MTNSFRAVEQSLNSIGTVHISCQSISGIYTIVPLPSHRQQRFLGQTKRCHFLEANKPVANQADPINLNQDNVGQDPQIPKNGLSSVFINLFLYPPTRLIYSILYTLSDESPAVCLRFSPTM